MIDSDSSWWNVVLCVKWWYEWYWWRLKMINGDSLCHEWWLKLWWWNESCFKWWLMAIDFALSPVIHHDVWEWFETFDDPVRADPSPWQDFHMIFRSFSIAMFDASLWIPHASMIDNFCTAAQNQHHHLSRGMKYLGGGNLLKPVEHFWKSWGLKI